MAMELVKPKRKYVRSTIYARTKTAVRERDRRMERLAKTAYEFLGLKPSDRPAVKAWAQMELLATEAYHAIRRNGVEKSIKLFNDYRMFRGTQLQWAKEIGLTPQARLRLTDGKDEREPDLVTRLAAWTDADEAETIAPGNGNAPPSDDLQESGTSTPTAADEAPEAGIPRTEGAISDHDDPNSGHDAQKPPDGTIIVEGDEF
jgi:hypothetical protein